MTKSKVLAQCKALLAVNPKATGTELAIAISGGSYKNDTYRTVTPIINELKREGKI